MDSKIESNTVTYHKITYDVKCKTGWFDSTSKHILKELSGVFRPGMNAIMGPTGSGKTTLLDILAGRKDSNHFQGCVLIGGRPNSNKRTIGYVVQDDVVMETLTVREHIEFSANLRLPRTYSREKKSQMVTDVITDLGLELCANTQVGSQYTTGVSGGERKRTSIAMELILSPAVLFLDEPTTGLDSNTAFSLMLLLEKLALSGKTVIFSVHQPRHGIFRLFNRLTLLCQGNTVYHGHADEVLEYFATVGYDCEIGDNPADYILDILNGHSSHINHPEFVKGATASRVIMTEQDLRDILAQFFAEEFVKSHWYSRCEEDLGPVLQNFTENSKNKSPCQSDGVCYALRKIIGRIWAKLGPNRAANGEQENLITESTPILGKHEVIAKESDCSLSPIHQLPLVTGRAFTNLIRNRNGLITEVIASSILAVMIGFIYFHVPNTGPTAIKNRVGAIFYTAMYKIFRKLYSASVFLANRNVFIHEIVSGYYKVSVYCYSMILLDLTIRHLLPDVVFAVIIYWMIGLKASAVSFCLFIMTMWLASIASAAISYVVGASVHTFETAFITLIFLFNLMTIFGGPLVSIDTITPWMRWLQYLSVIRYFVNAMLINEIKDLEVCNVEGNSTVCDAEGGNSYLDAENIPYKTEWDFWLNEVALAGIAAICLALTYIQLIRIKKVK